MNRVVVTVLHPWDAACTAGDMNQSDVVHSMERAWEPGSDSLSLEVSAATGQALLVSAYGASSGDVVGVGAVRVDSAFDSAAVEVFAFQ